MCLQEPTTNSSTTHYNKLFISPTDLIFTNNMNGSASGASYQINHNLYYQQPNAQSPNSVQSYNSNNTYLQYKNNLASIDIEPCDHFGLTSNFQSQNSERLDFLISDSELQFFHNKFESKFYDLIRDTEDHSTIPLFLNSNEEEFKQTNDLDEILSERETNASMSYPLQPIQIQQTYPASIYSLDANLENCIDFEQGLSTDVQGLISYENGDCQQYLPEIPSDSPCLSSTSTAFEQKEEKIDQETIFELIINRAKLPIDMGRNVPPFYISLRRYKRIMERRSKRDQIKKQKEVKKNVSQMNWHKCLVPNDNLIAAVAKKPLQFEQIFIIKRKPQKYRYESRHKQASNRQRDSKGRFIGKQAKIQSDASEMTLFYGQNSGQNNDLTHTGMPVDSFDQSPSKSKSICNGFLNNNSCLPYTVTCGLRGGYNSGKDDEGHPEEEKWDESSNNSGNGSSDKGARDRDYFNYRRSDGRDNNSHHHHHHHDQSPECEEDSQRWKETDRDGFNQYIDVFYKQSFSYNNCTEEKDIQSEEDYFQHQYGSKVKKKYLQTDNPIHSPLQNFQTLNSSEYTPEIQDFDFFFYDSEECEAQGQANIFGFKTQNFTQNF